jgi:hypothetical protein
MKTASLKVHVVSEIKKKTHLHLTRTSVSIITEHETVKSKTSQNPTCFMIQTTLHSCEPKASYMDNNSTAILHFVLMTQTGASAVFSGL